MALYQPAEDSQLLESIIPNYVQNKSVLDLGSGSGILAKSALNNNALSVTAADINPEAKLQLPKEIKFIESDLFSNISKKYDLIIFNPPYLPEDEREPISSRTATTAGKRGDEIILEFIKHAPIYLNQDGKILLLLSSQTPLDKINKLLKKLTFSKKVIAKKKLFMEELYVFEIAHHL